MTSSIPKDGRRRTEDGRLETEDDRQWTISPFEDDGAKVASASGAETADPNSCDLFFISAERIFYLRKAFPPREFHHYQFCQWRQEDAVWICFRGTNTMCVYAS
jgi:hypothetical protein